LPEEKRYRILADFLAQRYKVSRDITLDFVRIAHAAGHQIGLDPLLILAVMAVESQFNPIAESVAGAKGLMQVMPKYHEDKLEGFGGEAAVFDPRINILVGTQILKEYLSRAGNNLSTALQMYAGALADEQNVYTSKVMTEKQRLQQVMNAAQRKAAATRTAQTDDAPFAQSSTAR
jgi:soluble lytic murein transglycosylase-like protein